jgi:hypothetical protein
MSDFDDRELRDALRRRAGAASDGLGIEAARARVVARAGQVRRRRAAVAGGAAMAGLVAAAVFVIGPGSDSVVTTPADQTDGAPASSVDSSVDTTAPDPASPETTDPDRQVAVTRTPTTVSPDPTTTAPSAIPPTGTASTSTAPSTSAPAAPDTTVTSPPTSPPPTTTVAPAPDPITPTYSAAGGSITVRWDGVALSLLSVTPASGFDSEVEDERPDRIRVRFQGADGDFRIEIRIEDGEIVRIE